MIMQETINVTWNIYPGTKKKETLSFALLREDVIEKEVPDGVMPGNYRIGRLVGNKFRIIYIGRVDNRTDRGLKDRLIEHIEEWDGDLYFNWNDEIESEDAYRRECEDYHNWLKYEGSLENDIHPRKPNGKTNLKCPVCGQ